LRFGLLAGALGNAIGAVLRIGGFGKATFFLVAIGQTVAGMLKPTTTTSTTNHQMVELIVRSMLAAIAQPFILNAPPLVAANWFPENQRTIATTIASVANPVGVAIGFVLPPAVVFEVSIHHQHQILASCSA
jgi:hypothetical protein